MTEPILLVPSGQCFGTHRGGVCPTLRARDYKEPIVLVYDARGNGGGTICPTITGDHENRITDYTAIVVEEKHDAPSSGL